jgi:hypothetical protein
VFPDLEFCDKLTSPFTSSRFSGPQSMFAAEGLLPHRDNGLNAPPPTGIPRTCDSYPSLLTIYDRGKYPFYPPAEVNRGLKIPCKVSCEAEDFSRNVSYTFSDYNH